MDDLEYFAELREIEGLIPSGEALSLMAELNPPPPSWFDEGEGDPPVAPTTVIPAASKEPGPGGLDH